MKYFIFLKKIILVILICIFSACQDIPVEVEQALKLSKNNRVELEKVIKHYQKPQDSLKLKAAYFLIKNMSNKYTVHVEKIERLNSIFPAIEKARKKNLVVRDINSDKYLLIDSLWKDVTVKDGRPIEFNLSVNQDLNTVKGDYLIENIEYSFKVWNLPWSKHLTFEEFCEYILPYRISDEALISWRPLIYNKYTTLLDTLKILKIKDPVVVCKKINKILLSKWIYSPTVAKYPVSMTADNLMKCYMGSCKGQAALAIFTMRALGVPVVHERVAHYGNRSLGHDFNGVLDKKGKFVDFEAGDDKRFGHILDSQNDEERYIPKIFRKTYSLSNKSLAVLKPQNEEIPNFFMDPSIIDVTSKYLPVSTIKIKLISEIPKKCSYVYLCVFDNKNWRAIAWSKITDRQTIFENMGRGIVYMPMYYVNGKFVSASSPVTLNRMGEILTITPMVKEQKIILKRKYKPHRQMESQMMNSVFQASNTLDFKKTTDLYLIKDSIELIQKQILIKNHKKFRYVRYLVSPKRRGDISEISFLSERGVPLTGKIITSENTSRFKLDNNKIVKNTTVKNAFDKDILSFAVILEDSTQQWIGLDFGVKKNISKLSFCPRTDKNDVWPGLNYELFYWNKGWKSLGVKKALTNTLEYKSCISNALFLLRCLDEGEEERIFTYENGKQVWW